VARRHEIWLTNERITMFKSIAFTMVVPVVLVAVVCAAISFRVMPRRQA